MGLPPYGPEPYASANSATPAHSCFLAKRLSILAEYPIECKGELAIISAFSREVGYRTRVRGFAGQPRVRESASNKEGPRTRSGEGMCFEFGGLPQKIEAFLMKGGLSSAHAALPRLRWPAVLTMQAIAV